MYFFSWVAIHVAIVVSLVAISQAVLTGYPDLDHYHSLHIYLAIGPESSEDGMTHWKLVAIAPAAEFPAATIFHNMESPDLPPQSPGRARTFNRDGRIVADRQEYEFFKYRWHERIYLGTWNLAIASPDPLLGPHPFDRRNPGWLDIFAGPNQFPIQFHSQAHVSQQSVFTKVKALVAAHPAALTVDEIGIKEMSHLFLNELSRVWVDVRQPVEPGILPEWTIRLQSASGSSRTYRAPTLTAERPLASQIRYQIWYGTIANAATPGFIVQLLAPSRVSDSHDWVLKLGLHSSLMTVPNARAVLRSLEDISGHEINNPPPYQANYHQRNAWRERQRMESQEKTIDRVQMLKSKMEEAPSAGGASALAVTSPRGSSSSHTQPSSSEAQPLVRPAVAPPGWDSMLQGR